MRLTLLHPVGNVFMFSIYVYSISFLYLPSTHKSLKEDFGDFSLATARYLCDMAWQAYLQVRVNVGGCST